MRKKRPLRGYKKKLSPKQQRFTEALKQAEELMRRGTYYPVTWQPHDLNDFTDLPTWVNFTNMINQLLVKATQLGIVNPKLVYEWPNKTEFIVRVKA